MAERAERSAADEGKPRNVGIASERVDRAFVPYAPDNWNWQASGPPAETPGLDASLDKRFDAARESSSARADAHDPLDPIPRRLRPCRQFGGGVPVAAAGLRGLADPYRAVLQPCRLSRLAGQSVRRGHDRRMRRRACGRSACSRDATAFYRAISAGRKSARRRCGPSMPCAARTPDAVYACDPVIGDVGRGVYVAPGVGEFFRDRALPQATILTPNAFELEWLTGLPVGNLAAGPRRARRAAFARAEGHPRHLARARGHARRRARHARLGRRPASGACARLGCRSPSTAPAISSRRCSSFIGCARAPRPRRLPAPPPASTASSRRPRRRASANWRSSRRRTNSCGRRGCSGRNNCRSRTMRRAFHTLDVFTETPLAGNPLAVVLDSEGLDDARMQSDRPRVQSGRDGVRVASRKIPSTRRRCASSPPRANCRSRAIRPSGRRCCSRICARANC